MTTKEAWVQFAAATLMQIKGTVSDTDVKCAAVNADRMLLQYWMRFGDENVNWTKNLQGMGFHLKMDELAAVPPETGKPYR